MLQNAPVWDPFLEAGGVPADIGGITVDTGSFADIRLMKLNEKTRVIGSKAQFLKAAGVRCIRGSFDESRFENGVLQIREDDMELAPLQEIMGAFENLSMLRFFHVPLEFRYAVFPAASKALQYLRKNAVPLKRRFSKIVLNSATRIDGTTLFINTAMRGASVMADLERVVGPMAAPIATTAAQKLPPPLPSAKPKTNGVVHKPLTPDEMKALLRARLKSVAPIVQK